MGSLVQKGGTQTNMKKNGRVSVRFVYQWEGLGALQSVGSKETLF